MAYSSDMIVDRRQLRRQLTFWRVVAVVIALAAIIGAGLVWSGAFRTAVPHVARITIDGLITGKQETVDLLRSADRASVGAVVLRINSGGGTTAGSETLYTEIRRLAEKKPVVAVIDGVGASGAYMAALGAHRIIANGSGLVGSIGVIAQIPNFTKLLDNVGVKVEAVRSSPLKAMPSGIEPTTPEARLAVEETVLDTYRWFRTLVGERRGLSGDALGKVTDGRVFTGRQALELKLIDAIGGEREAITWLETEKGLAKNLPVRRYTPQQAVNRIPGLGALGAMLGLIVDGSRASLADQAREVLGADALDGLVSVWHPSKQ